MQQVQDQLDFKIHTPTDEQLAKQMEFYEYYNHVKMEVTRAFGVPGRLLGGTTTVWGGKTKNQKKRSRKKQRNARRLSRV